MIITDITRIGEQQVLLIRQSDLYLNAWKIKQL